MGGKYRLFPDTAAGVGDTGSYGQRFISFPAGDIWCIDGRKRSGKERRSVV